MSNEVLEVLNMVSEGTITPEEGEKLINALKNQERRETTSKPSFIRIKVSDVKNKDDVNVKLPIGLLSTGIKLAEKFSPDFKATGLTKEDMDEIIQAIKNGDTGKIIDVEKESGEKVEIIVE